MEQISSITRMGQPGAVAASSTRAGEEARPLSLLDPRFEHDSCGVGFVAATNGQAEHSILQMALTALARLAHRGAVAADGASSDGVGLMTAIPRELLLGSMGLALPPEDALGVGVVFLPEGATGAETALEGCLRAQGFAVLGWREVPVRTEVLGAIARSTLPRIKQVLVREAGGAEGEIERRLYLARKSFERQVVAGEVKGYVCSLSSEVIVYKAMCLGRLLPEFYADLQAPEYRTRFAIFHQRYATNTLPAWHRAQPGRKLAHNGEINTVWGNRARMDARDHSLPEECKPVITPDGTDSTSLDEVLELISHNGRTLAESVRMLLPPAVVPPSKASSGAEDRVSPFLRYHAAVGRTGCDCVFGWADCRRGAGPERFTAVKVRDHQCGVGGRRLGGGPGGP